MGQTQSSTLSPDSARTGHQPVSFLGELGHDQYAYIASIGSGATRCLRAIKAKFQGKDGVASLLVVKVFLKPDPSTSLKAYTKVLQNQRDALLDAPNIFTYQRIFETERAGYVIRQWIASSLYDRISTRPFLSLLEKKWIAFQLLTALGDARLNGIGHGDIKSENVLITSSLWIYLADFAPFKPVYLPLDDPWQFNYFFDSSARRTCYIAPERFVPSTAAKEGELTEAMDVFSVGCVLAEMFCDGVPPFSLSQLFSYRRGEYKTELETYLRQIEDSEMLRVISTMLSLDPTTRGTAADHLNSTAFPPLFRLLHRFIDSVSNCIPPHPVSQTPRPSQPTTKTPGSINAIITDSLTKIEPTLKTNADERIDQLVQSWDDAVEFLGQRPDDSKKHPKLDDPAAILFLTLVSSCIRNCLKPGSIIQALDLFLYLSSYLTDETNIDRMLPYIVDMLADDSPMVRSAACRALTQLLLLVEFISPANASIFNDYVLPNIKPMASDAEPSVRITFAQCLVPLAESGARFISMAGWLRVYDKSKKDRDELEENDEGSYDTKMAELHENIIELVVQLLLADPVASVRRALVHNIAPLCIFLGRDTAADVLLSHMVTFLNDHDWMLRAAFFESAVDIASCVGRQSVEDYILPLMLQALAGVLLRLAASALNDITTDAEETVVARVLSSLTTLSELQLLPRKATWDLLDTIVGFVCHPNLWIRQGVAAFLASSARLLSQTDVWCILYPPLRRLLRCDVTSITETEILAAASRPLPRPIFEAAISWASKYAAKSAFWKTPGSSSNAQQMGLLPSSMQKKIDKERHLTDEDNSQLDRLRQLGLTAEDEIKLEALRDHILKVTTARQMAHREPTSQQLLGNVTLQNYGVTPRSIFFNAPSLPAKEEPISPHLARLESRDRRRPSMDSIISLRGGSPTAGHRNFSDTSAVDDLRRRLALSAGPSSSSITSTSAPDDAVRTRARIDSKGVAVTRVSPALGKDTTPAIGHFNLDVRYRDDDASAVSMPSARPEHNGLPNQKLTSTYEGNDPNIKQLIERAYLETRKEMPIEFGEHVADGIPKRRAVRASAHSSRDRSSSGHPEGTLISHLSEHEGAIVDLVVSPDSVFFASGSLDGTVKIWDAMRLEKNVTARSRLTIPIGSKVTALCRLQHTHCIACASKEGYIQIYRIDVQLSGSLPKYSKQQLVRQYAFDDTQVYATGLVHYELDNKSLLICATSNSNVLFLDVKTMQVVSKLSAGRQFGAFTSLCIDPRKLWVVVATSYGYLLLFDLRFNLLVKTINTNHSGPVDHRRRISHCGLHPTKGKGRWIVVSAEVVNANQSSVEIWDLGSDKLVEQFRVEQVTRGHSRQASQTSLLPDTKVSLSDASSNLSPAAAIEQLLKLAGDTEVPPAEEMDVARWDGEDIGAFVLGTDYSNATPVKRTATQPNPSTATFSSGELVSYPTDHTAFMITGGQDLKLRFWDLDNVERSSVISSPEETKSASYSTVHGKESGQPAQYIERSIGQENQRHRSTLIASYQTSLLRAHQDAVTSIAVLQLPFKCVISGDRKGIIKITA